jgi:hypothetical protein
MTTEKYFVLGVDIVFLSCYYDITTENKPQQKQVKPGTVETIRTGLKVGKQLPKRKDKTT